MDPRGGRRWLEPPDGDSIVHVNAEGDVLT